MMHLDIPIEAFWAAIGFLLVTAGGFAIWFIAWRGQVLTIDKHAEICDVRQSETKEKIHEVKEILEAQNRSSDEYRSAMSIDVKNLTTNVSDITTKVAVLEERSTHPATTVNVQRA